MSFGQGFGGLFGGADNGRGNDRGAGGSGGPGGTGGLFGNGPGEPGQPDRPGRGGGDGGSSSAEGRSRGPRRPSALVLTIVVVAALVVLFFFFAGVYADVLWYHQIGYSEVFWTEIWTRAALFVIGGLVMGVAVWLSMWLAWRKRPRNLHSQTRDSLAQYQKQLEPIRRLVFIGIPVAIGFFAGSAAMNAWQGVLLFFNQEAYGQTDPEFGLDFTFYMATLPFLGLVVGYLISVVLIAGIAGLLVHYLYGGIRVKEQGGIAIERPARVHIAVFAALFLLLQAGNYWLNRYRTVQSQEGNWAGALYTDVNAVIPTSAILAVAAVLVAILFVVTAFTGRWRISLVGTAVLIVVAVLVGSAYPFLVQEYQVRPTEQTLEREYLGRNIQLTREAYGLNDTEVTGYAGETETEAGALADEGDNTANIRLLDPNLISRTFGQLQQFRPYYGFPDTLHFDRYDVDGQVEDQVVAAREVTVDPASSWVNQHIIYTHGYGMVAADASEVAAGGRPAFTLSGIPTRGPLATDEDYEPRIYFGLNSPEYSVVGAPEGAPDRERDRPQDATSDEDTTYTFTGNGGPSVGGFFNQLIYAIKFGSTELLLSQDVTSESQILYDRNPVQRVEKVAPYLEVDSNPYPAIVDGRIQWIVDAYTTSNAFPYSTQEQLDVVTTDALNPDQAGNLAGQVNYIRNSVKATVDAYSGEVTLYAWEEDPLLQAWQKVYPNSLRPYSEMSAALLDHVRYPEDMFKVQRAVMEEYHVTDPDDFFENNDAWSVPADPTQDNADVLQPPYYMTLQMPGKEEPSFQLTTTFIPQQREGTTTRNVLYGFMSANGDAGTGEDGVKAESYGHLQLLELPRSTAVPGPGQAQAQFDSNAQVSTELNLLRQGASEVINGNLITLPVANGILYVQPVYVQSTGPTSYPTLRRVLVSFGDQVGFADTLEQALDQVFGGDSGAVTSEGETGQTEDGAEPGSQPQVPETQSPQQQLSQALTDANAAILAGEEALANGDWAAYGEAQTRLNEALSRALEADEAITGESAAPAPAEGAPAEGAPTEGAPTDGATPEDGGQPVEGEEPPAEGGGTEG